jgi:arylsulfatase A-like enzyme
MYLYNSIKFKTYNYLNNLFFSKAMNVLIIVVDAARVDHLGVSGYSRQTSPNIDKLAKQGIFFKNSICTIPRTSPSIASILTGLYPHSHKLRFLFTHKLGENITTLPQILRNHNYKTIGNDIEMNGTGIDEGFGEFNLLKWRLANKVKRTLKKTYRWKYEVNPAETLTDFTIKKIEDLKNDKFFLYIHYVGLHWPYSPPSPYNEMFDPDYKGDHSFNKVQGDNKRGKMIFENKMSKEEIYHSIAHYDGSIKFIDDQIGKIIDSVEKLGLSNTTMVIITADHGECFGEHGMFFQHGEYLYDEAIKTPLIIKYPGCESKIIDTQVQSTDIFPTVLELLDIPAIDKLDGVSLLPLINDFKAVRKYTYCESGRSFFKQNRRVYFDGVKGKWRAIRTDEWKLIYIPHPQKDIYELYNLKEDPFEKDNLYGKKLLVADELKQELFKWIQDIDEKEKLDLTTKSKDLLKKLGYME